MNCTRTSAGTIESCIDDNCCISNAAGSASYSDSVLNQRVLKNLGMTVSAAQ